ncbi:unnamed protein product [Lymnaea stagnalis]|uniref:Cytochrome c oxidase assembly protein COX16 homolog, mitochondrial n=1 Tax=Lymnaea stagnalis TaxID=6523 RepID=A0AAV2IAU8_LYMST
MAETIRSIWGHVMKRKFLRRGIPFVLFVAGGSVFLKQFASLRYEFRKSQKLSNEQAEALGLKSGNVEAAIQEMLEEIEQRDLEDWENIRGPRPWEDSKTVQTELRQALKPS